MTKNMRVWLRMSYSCCGLEWDDEWPEALRLECPDCGELIEAFSIVEIVADDQVEAAAGETGAGSVNPRAVARGKLPATLTCLPHLAVAAHRKGG